MAGAAVRLGWPHWVAYNDSFRVEVEGDHSRLREGTKGLGALHHLPGQVR